MAKKRKRVKKKDKAFPTRPTEEDQTLATTATATATEGSPSLLGESMLSRLRTRLDPLYNTSSPPPPPTESSPLPPVRLPPLEYPTSSPRLPTATEGRGSERAGVHEDTSVREVDTTEGSASQRGSHRRKRRRKNNNDTQEASQSPRQPSGSQEGAAAASEDVTSEQQKELKLTSREALIAGATDGSERKKRRRRERERERSRRTSGRSVGENAPDAGEEITAKVTGEGLDSNFDDGVPPPTNEGIIKHYVYVCMFNNLHEL